jgi:hypothetical protein
MGMIVSGIRNTTTLPTIPSPYRIVFKAMFLKSAARRNKAVMAPPSFATVVCAPWHFIHVPSSFMPQAPNTVNTPNTNSTESSAGIHFLMDSLRCFTTRHLTLN